MPGAGQHWEDEETDKEQEQEQEPKAA